jgi:hypothetical protein
VLSGSCQISPPLPVCTLVTILHLQPTTPRLCCGLCRTEKLSPPYLSARRAVSSMCGLIAVCKRYLITSQRPRPFLSISLHHTALEPMEGDSIACRYSVLLVSSLHLRTGITLHWGDSSPVSSPYDFPRFTFIDSPTSSISRGKGEQRGSDIDNWRAGWIICLSISICRCETVRVEGAIKSVGRPIPLTSFPQSLIISLFYSFLLFPITGQPRLGCAFYNCRLYYRLIQQ